MLAAVGSHAAILAAPERPIGAGPASAARGGLPGANDSEAGSTAAAGAAKESGNRAGADELTEEEQKQVQKLKQRDAEVRAHERAHATAGGTLAGSPSFQTERGPDGRTYAVGGEVAIDVSPAQTPNATIAKADQIVRAAMAPADPSPQDMRVAASARQMRAEAQAELIKLQAEEASGKDEGGPAGQPADLNGVPSEVSAAAQGGEGPGSGGLNADAQFTARRAYDEATRLLPQPAA